MPRYEPAAFAAVVTLTLCAGLVGYTSYDAASAFCSDLPQYGIQRGTSAYREVVAIVQEQSALVGIPLGFTNVLALCGWGLCLLHGRRIERERQSRENNA